MRSLVNHLSAAPRRGASHRAAALALLCLVLLALGSPASAQGAAAPTLSVAATGDGNASLSWTTVPDADYYYLYRSTTEGGPYSLISYRPAGTTSYNDGGLQNGVNYYYVVQAFDGTGAGSGYSNELLVSFSIGAPTLSVTGTGDGTASLSWSAVPNADYYYLYRSTTEGGPYSLISYRPAGTTSYNDGNLQNGVNYYYVVLAGDNGGQSALSNEVSVSFSIGAPTLQVASTGDGTASLSWSPVSNADYYYLYRATTSGGPYSLISYRPAGTTTYNDSGLQNGVNYYYVVLAGDNGGQSVYSNEVSASFSIGAPTLSVTGTGDGTASLSWSPVSNADYYYLYRSTTEGGPYTFISYRPAGTTTYTDSNLQNGVNYYYVVLAGDNGGQSAYSNEVTASFSIAAPTLTATAGSDSIALSWTTVSNADYYYLYRATTSGGPYNFISYRPAGSTSYTDGGVQSGTVYYYVVQAFDNGGGSGYSNEASASFGVATVPPDDAAFVSQSVPAVMTCGQTYAVSITMQNRGSNTWTDGANYHLGSQDPQDNATWGTNRQILPSGSVVAPGDQVTFNFTVTAPSTPGTYPFQWQMVHEGVAWFGDLTPAVSVTVAPSAVPTTPTGLTAMPGDGRVSLSWAGATGATSYNVKRSTVSGGPYATVASGVSGTTYTDTGLTDRTPYYYVISGVNALGEGADSAEASATPVTGDDATFVSQSVPTSMTGGQSYPVSVTFKNNGTNTWTADANYRLGSQDISTWGLGRAFLPAGASVPPGAQVTFSFSVTAPVTTGTYNFQWQMVQEGVTWFGDLTPNVSVSVTGAPAPPVTLTGIPGDGTVALSWTVSPAATGYNVKRALTRGGPYTTIAAGVTGTTYTDTGLTYNTTYYYVVSATSAFGEGANSNELAIDDLPAPVLTGTPYDLNLDNVNGAYFVPRIILNWTPVIREPLSNSYLYYVWQASSPDGPFTVANSTFASTKDYPILSSPSYYKVQAVTINGSSPFSNVVCDSGLFVTVNAAEVSLSRGQTTSSTVTVTLGPRPTATFPMDVTLALSGLPSGITAWLYPPSATLTAPLGGHTFSHGSSTLFLYCPPGVSIPAGQYPLTVTGTGGGSSATAPLTITVN